MKNVKLIVLDFIEDKTQYNRILNNNEYESKANQNRFYQESI